MIDDKGIMQNHRPKIRKAIFRFYEELNDHLPKHQRKTPFVYAFKGKPSVKNTVQALGVPHGEIDLILVNGEPVDFDYQLQGGERISVFPVFESLDVSSISRLRPKPLREVRFVVDVNLGKLALKLRLLGFDTLFRNNLEDDEIVRIALKDRRIILTRDKEILKQNTVKHGYFLRSQDPVKQVGEVVGRLQLQQLIQPFIRCSVCNGLLVACEKQEVKQKVKADTFEFYDEFWRCMDCGKVYWKGSHYDKIMAWAENLKH